MRRKFEGGLALVVAAVAAVGIFGPSLSASGQIPPPPTMPPFTFTVPSFTRPTFTIPPTSPPPTMPPPTTATTSPPPTMPPPTSPPPTRPSVTLPPSAQDAIESVIETLEQFGDQFSELIDELQALFETF